MKNRTKAMYTSALAALLILPGAAAFASTTYRTFTDNRLPQAQQGVDVINDTKSTTGAGSVNFSNIGSDYKVNARICKIVVVQTGQRACGTEIQNIAENRTVSLPNDNGNRVTAGQNVRLELHNSVWAAVHVSVSGTGRTN